MASQSCQEYVDCRIGFRSVASFEWEESVIFCVGDLADGAVSFDSIDFDCHMTWQTELIRREHQVACNFSHHQRIGTCQAQ